MHKMPYNFLSAISTMQQQKPMERGEVGVGNFIGVFKLSTRSSEVFYFMLCFSYFPMPFVAQPVVLSHICKRATPALSFSFSFRFGYSMNVRICIWTLYVGWAMVMGPFSWSWSWSLWRWLFIMRISGFYASVSGMFSYTYLNIVLKRLHMWSMRGWLAANWNGGPFPFSHFPILSLFPYIPLKHLVSKCQYFPPRERVFNDVAGFMAHQMDTSTLCPVFCNAFDNASMSIKSIIICLTLCS